MSERKTVLERIYGFRIVTLIVVLLAALSLASRDFFSLRTVEKSLLLLPSDGVVAVGVTLVMIAGDLGVSVGGVLSVSGLILVKLLPHGLWVAVIAALAAGAAIGFVNGYVVNRLKVNSLISTVAMGFVLSGVSFLLAGQSVGFKNETLTDFGNLSLWVFPVLTLFSYAVTALGGGNGDVIRTLPGVILLSLLTKGFTQLQVPAYYQNMVIGAILILLLFAGEKLSQRSG